MEDARTHEPFPVHECGRNRRLVGPALGHQKMEVHVEIDPVPKGLDGGDDPGRKRAPGHNTHGVIVSMSTGKAAASK
jgi:hypothetical protein